MRIILSIVLTTTWLTSAYTQGSISSAVDAVKDYAINRHVPGLMLTIVEGDSTLFQGGIGVANVATKEPATEDHLFRQGSISKTFAAMGVLQLSRKQGFSVDAPLRSLDEEIPFTNPWSATHPLRLVHLLEHTSGFDDFHAHAIYNQADAVAPPARQLVEAHRNSLTARWTPGLKKSYANPNYIVLGQLLESRTGRGYADYLVEEVLRPLGMASSGYFFKQPTTTPMAQGYTWSGKKHEEVPFTSVNGGPAGELCASARDMASFLKVMLTRTVPDTSLLLDKAAFARMERSTSTVAARAGLPFGYGFGISSIWKNGYLWHGHGGGIDGFSSRYLYSHEAGLGIAVSMNRQGNATEVVELVMEELLGKRQAAPADRKVESIPIALQERYTGFYEFECPRSELLSFSETMLAGLILDIGDSTVVTRTILGKPRDTLFYAGNGKFYQNDEGTPSTIVFDTPTGEPGFWINQSYTVQRSRARRLFLFFSVFLSVLLLLSYAVSRPVVLAWRYVFGRSATGFAGLLPAATGACIAMMFLGFALTFSHRDQFDGMGFGASLLYLSSFAMLGCAVGGLVRIPAMRGTRGFRVYYLLATVSALVLALYLCSIGFVGLRLWDY